MHLRLGTPTGAGGRGVFPRCTCGSRGGYLRLSRSRASHIECLDLENLAALGEGSLREVEGRVLELTDEFGRARKVRAGDLQGNDALELRD